ncbi:MAG: glycoside hydrolase family 32 protein [Bacteroidales bacterium]|nr:glycoside hydrolase family 32 protein [Bacteroidales bacterium]
MKTRLFVTILLATLTAPVSLFAQEPVQKEFKVKQRYLNIPVYDDRPSKVLTFSAKGIDPLDVDVCIAQGEPDYWVYKDLTPYMGKKLKLTYEGDKADLDKLFVADTIVGQSTFYKEANRPQFHFTTRRGWNNDPNGMVYYNGEYHLYYQHNPYKRYWGNMHWGHAVSRDLVHWEELGDVLFPDNLGAMFSGSAVVDKNNTSGWGTKECPSPIVYAYTAHAEWQTQCMAYSLDGGRTLVKYEANPVVNSHVAAGSHETRDPRLLWYGGEDGHWVMVLFEKDGNSFYTSDDLKNWTYKSHIAGFDECPDLFCLPVDGDKNNMKWVTLGAAGLYMVGDFDGKTFTPISGRHQYTTGDFYAAQTFTNTPDGRCIQIGWGRISHPGMPFNSQMQLPTELTLRTTRDGIRLASNPVKEVEQLLHRQYTAPGILNVDDANKVLARFTDPGQGLHIKAKLKMDAACYTALKMNGKECFTYSPSYGLFNDAFYSTEDITGLSFPIEIFIDRTGVEIFIDNGLYSWSRQLVCDKPARLFEFEGWALNIYDFVIDTVDSIW